MLQNMTEFRCPIHQLLRNTEAETTKMIYKLIYLPTFRTILIYFVN